LNNPT